jgi:predicted nucleotidyltransferase
MALYRAGHRRRRQLRADLLAQRSGRAWQVARAGAALLRDQFGVARVVVFGSLLGPDQFHERSDVDLAVWGLDERDYFRAVGRLLAVDAAIMVDLVAVESAPPHLLEAILREGVDL